MHKISLVNQSCCGSFPANLPDTMSIFGNIISLKFSGSPKFHLSYNYYHLPVNILPQIVFQKYFRSSLLKINILHFFFVVFNNIHLKVYSASFFISFSSPFSSSLSDPETVRAPIACIHTVNFPFYCVCSFCRYKCCSIPNAAIKTHIVFIPMLNTTKGPMNEDVLRAVPGVPFSVRKLVE